MHARLLESDTMQLTSIRSLLLLSAQFCGSHPGAGARSSAIGGETDAPSAQTSQPPEEAIIVTARRREESAQDVPLAISVIGGEQLDATGAFNVQRLQQLTPALHFYSSNPRNTAINIRGIGVPFGLTNDGFDQGVGIYVDDVYFARIASATLDFLDVEQIEVLRGPQGTLYGKNTTAGRDQHHHQPPDLRLRRQRRGELRQSRLQAGQGFGLRPAVGANWPGGLPFPPPAAAGTIYNVATGNWINEQDNLGLRGQLLWEPERRSRSAAGGRLQPQDPECCAQIYVRTGATQRPLNRQYAALSAAQGYQVVSTNPFDRLTDVDAPSQRRQRDRRWFGARQVGYRARHVHLDHRLSLLGLEARERSRLYRPADQHASNNPSQQNQYTQEFRYSHVADNFDFVIGAFAFHQEVRTQGPDAVRPRRQPLADQPQQRAGERSQLCSTG